METRWDSLLSHPDSCPTDRVHLTYRISILVQYRLNFSSVCSHSAHFQVS